MPLPKFIKTSFHLMKILLISQVPSEFERWRQPQEAFPEFQSQSFWLKALDQLGHQVSVFKYSDPIVGSSHTWSQISRLSQKVWPRVFRKYRWWRNRYYHRWLDNHWRSRRLIKLAADFQPDIVLFSGGISELAGPEIAWLEDHQIPCLLLHGVHPDQGATSYELDHIQSFTQIIVNDPSHAQAWLALGAKRANAVPYAAIDPDYYHDLGLARTIDVLFVGTLFAERQQFFKRLFDRGLKVHLAGYVPKHVGLDPRLAEWYTGEAWGREMVTLFNQAKIVINLVPDHMPIGGNMRTFEIPGCGALQLASRCPTDWYQPNKEIVLFSSDVELIEKITYYLNHPKKAGLIARQGYQRTHQDHTYSQRFKHILKPNLSIMSYDS